MNPLKIMVLLVLSISMMLLCLIIYGNLSKTRNSKEINDHLDLEDYKYFIDFIDEEVDIDTANYSFDINNITDNKLYLLERLNEIDSASPILKNFIIGKIKHYQYLEIIAARNLLIALHNRLYFKPLYYKRFEYIFPIEEKQSTNYKFSKESFNYLNKTISEFYINSINNYGESFYSKIPELNNKYINLNNFNMAFNDIIIKLDNFTEFDSLDWKKIEFFNFNDHAYSNFIYLEKLSKKIKDESVYNLNKILEKESGVNVLDTTMIVSTIQSLTFYSGIDQDCEAIQYIFDKYNFIIDDLDFYLTSEDNLVLFSDYLDILPFLIKCDIITKDEIKDIVNSYDNPFIINLINNTIHLKFQQFNISNYQDNFQYIDVDIYQMEDYLDEEYSSLFLLIYPIYQLLYAEYLYVNKDYENASDNVINQFWFHDNKYSINNYWTIQNYNEYFFRSFIIGSWDGGRLPLWNGLYLKIQDREPTLYRDMLGTIGYYQETIIKHLKL